jgi:hypothetical protein
VVDTTGDAIAQDKCRIVTQLRCNLQNMPDDAEEVAALVPWMTVQATALASMLHLEDFRPAELMGLLSLLGPVVARSSPLASPKNQGRSLRAV